jgi:hypothetical protein
MPEITTDLDLALAELALISFEMDRLNFFRSIATRQQLDTIALSLSHYQGN